MASAALPALPIELWLQIFRWATLTPSTPALYATEYRPFEITDIRGYDEARSMKRTLVLVCKHWRMWATPLLYEDILIPRAHLPLNRMLREGEDHHDGTAIPPCARAVRRVQLPYSSTVITSPKPIEPVEVLALCPSVEVLVRTADALSPIAYEFDTVCPPLPSLKRVDWWHHNEAARTGGINSLPHVLGEAPNLEYLSVGGEIWPNFLVGPSVHLPHLATLRLRRVNAFFVLQLSRWKLPALTHIIFEHIQSADIYWPLWTEFDAQVRTVEFGLSLRFYVRDFLAIVLGGFTHLEELNYYIHFTHAPQTDRPQETLHTIGLHASANSFYRTGSPEFWSHLGQHFEAFTETVFPALQRVKLYGDWSDVVEDKEFERLAKPLRDRGCKIEAIA